MQEKSIYPFFAHSKLVAFLLKVSFLGLPNLEGCLDHHFHLFWVESVKDSVKEVSLWKSQVSFPSWLWKIRSHVWKTFHHLRVGILDRQLWPVGYSLGWYVLLKDSLLSSTQDVLEVAEASALQRWEEIPYCSKKSVQRHAVVTYVVQSCRCGGLWWCGTET